MGFFSKTDALDEQLSFKSAAPIEELLDIPVDVVVEDEVVETEPEIEGEAFTIETFWDQYWKASFYRGSGDDRQLIRKLPSYIDGDGNNGEVGGHKYMNCFMAQTREEAIQHAAAYLVKRVANDRAEAEARANGQKETVTVYL